MRLGGFTIVSVVGFIAGVVFHSPMVSVPFDPQRGHLMAAFFYGVPLLGASLLLAILAFKDGKRRWIEKLLMGVNGLALVVCGLLMLFV